MQNESDSKNAIKYSDNIATGKIGEALALKYLTDIGYTIIDKNFRIGRMGEIDIIAQYQNYICFIEVKTRKSTRYGMPAESVTWNKQKKIMRLAGMYLLKNKIPESDIRFDVVEVFLGKHPQIKVIPNAFTQ